MKRLALTLFITLTVLHYSSAQIFRAGFYAGATMTDIPGTDNIDNDSDFKHLGFTIGGTVSARISPKSILQMEIRYIQRGSQQNPVVDSTGYIQPGNYFTMTLNYVDMVIGIKHQVHFNLRNAATDKYGIEGGVSIGSLINYSYSVNQVNYTLSLNRIDVSPYVGIYYNVTPHFYIEGRYSNSIVSAIKHDNSNPNSFYNVYYGTWDAGHNVAFSLTLGFIFGSTNSPASKTPPSVTPSIDATDN